MKPKPPENKDGHSWYYYNAPTTWGDWPVGNCVTFICTTCNLLFRQNVHNKTDKAYAIIAMGYPSSVPYEKCYKG